MKKGFDRYWRQLDTIKTQLEARRRDFTLNALYATPEGCVVDPLGGLPDCLNRRIRFIENADIRIQEDYLRILRYFRFHAWYAHVDDGFDPDALDAITRNTQGLDRLSAERIGSEIMKLLRAPDPVPAMASMKHTGTLCRILPGSDDRLLGPIVHLSHLMQIADDPVLRLAALGGTDTKERLRLSRADSAYLEQLKCVGFGAMPLPEAAYRFGLNVAQGAAILRSALADSPPDRAEWQSILSASKARFPVKAKDLMPALTGKALGDELRVLEQRWINSGFSLTRDDLVAKE